MMYIILAFVFSLQLSCENNTQQMIMNDEDVLFNQYAYLLEKSMKYDFHNDSFKYVVQTYLDTCTEYSAQIESRVDPFKGDIPIQLKPYLFNNAEDKVIIMAIIRSVDQNNNPLDYVHFIIGNYSNEKWAFSLKERYVRSFSYENSYPQLSDTEISIRILRTLIDAGYMPPDKVKINDNFFETDDW